MSNVSITRRQMLGTAAGGAAAASLLSAGVSGLRGEIATKGRPRVGVIGIGGRGKAHVRSFGALSDRCQVTAICDIVPEKAARGVELAGGGAIKTFASHKDLVQSGLCDAAVVATPNYTHKPIVLDLLAGGLHVLCEKPMATTLADARDMVDAVRKSARVFAVGLQFRYTALYRKVRELVKSGVIGELKYVWAEEFRGDWRKIYDDPKLDAQKNWRFFRRLSGGTLVEKVCHDFDILGWIIDANPTSVTAMGGTTVYGARETLDHASVVVDYEDGVKLTLGMCMFAPKMNKAEIVLIGTKGMIVFPRDGEQVVVRLPGMPDESVDVTARGTDTYGHHGTRELAIDFLDSVSAGRPPFADVNVGYSALRIPIAAQEAIRQHRIMEMEQF